MAEVGPHRPKTTPIGLSSLQFSIFPGESTGQGSLPLVFQEHLLPRQYDGRYAGAKTPQGCSRRTAHDEPCVQVFSGVRHWSKYFHKPHHTHQCLCRSANYTPPGHYIKCFHNTEHVLTLHNHYPTRCLGKQLSFKKSGCNFLFSWKGDQGCLKGGAVDTSLGHLQHYREYCVSELKKTCKETYMSNIERDTSVWKWREIVTKMLTEKGMI